LILDACRDNPFKAALATGRGLAPLDAPAGTFLAYATAPGNVAEDGDIADGNGNGLYTQYLLQELQGPAAKIEDVFKRVRLSVRKKSQGRQIPWESTSLEEDFYFNDGIKFTFKPEFLAQVKAQAEAKRAQRSAEESKAREREQQLVLEQTKERERQTAAAQAAEQQRVADENRAKEIKRLAADTQAIEQARLVQEVKAREAQRLALDAAAKQRESAIAQEQAAALQAQATRERERVAEQARIAELERAVAKAKSEPPVAKVTPEQAREQQLKSARIDWEVVKGSSDPEVLYAFLAKHPTGTELTEMAQHRLDQLSKPLVLAALGQGQQSSLAYRGPRFKLGDEFQYEQVDMLTKNIERTYRRKVTAIEKDTVRLNDDAAVFTVLGAVLTDDRGSYDPPFAGQPAEFQIGKKWASSTTQSARDGRSYALTMDSKIVAVETITVPAGTFQTYVIEATQYVPSGFSSGSIQRRKHWYDPRYGLPIRSEVVQYGKNQSIQRSERREMISLNAARD
jgi:Caspase domain